MKVEKTLERMTVMDQNARKTREDTRSCNVFISWTGYDKALKEKIKAYLDANGVYCPDSEEACAGQFEDWSRESGGTGTVFLLLLTPNSAKRQYVREEVASAKQMEDAANRILPVTTTTEFYYSHGFGLGEELKCSAICLGERSGTPYEGGGYVDDGEISEEKLQEILEKVKSLLANRASMVFCDRMRPRHMKLAPYFHRMRKQGVSQVPFDALYVTRKLAEDADGGEATVFDTPAPILSSDVSFLHGPAGSGKSRYIDELRLFAERESAEGLPELIVTLSCAAIAADTRPLMDVLFEKFKASLGAAEFYRRENFDDLLVARARHGRPILLVLDGFDEIAAAAQKRALLDKIEALYTANAAAVRLLFTSRNESDAGQIAIAGKSPRVFRLLPLEEEGVRRLCEKLFLLFEDEAGGNAFYLSVEKLSAEIRQNPLLLSQLAIVYKEENKIPETEFGILDAVREITFRREEQIAGSEKYPDLLEQVERWLALFAKERYRLMGLGKSVSSEAVFAKLFKSAYPIDHKERARFLADYLEDRAVFVDDGFYHKVFLEYFAAVRYYEESFDDYDEIEDEGVIAELFSHYGDPYWEKLIKLYLVKADSAIDAETTAILYRTVLASAKVTDYTLLLEACRDLLRFKDAAERVLTLDLLQKSADGTYPAYGPLFWYIPEFGLFETALRVLEDLKDSEAFSAALALVRDVCFLFSGSYTASAICAELDGQALLASAKLSGVRRALCELFYRGASDYQSTERVYPRLFDVEETRSVMTATHGLFERMLTPFADELGLFAHDMLPTLDGEYIGFLSLPYDDDASATLTARKTRHVRALAWTPTEKTVMSYVPFNRSAVEVVYLPENVEECEKDWCLHMPLRLFVECLAQIPVYAYNGILFIPEGVTEIGKQAFSLCTMLKEIHIPEGVTKIEGGAFEGCTALKEIHIPEGVKKIGYEAFVCCTALEEIRIPQSVTTIELGVFFGCTALKDIYIPKSVTEIGGGAFSSCTELQKIYIPAGVTRIGHDAFSGCTSLKEIHIPEGVTEIGARTFEGCTVLKEIHIPEGVTNIGWRAFSGCTALEEIYIPEGVTNIGSDAFSGCTSMKTVTMPFLFKYRISKIFGKKRNQIAFYFLGEENFASDKEKDENGNIIYSFPDGTKSITKDLLPPYYDHVVSFILPDSVISISAEDRFHGNLISAFDHCVSLRKIHIPEGVKKIGYEAFVGCTALKEIHIPEGVTEIGKSAFEGCTSLQTVTMPALFKNRISAIFGEQRNDIVFHFLGEEDFAAETDGNGNIIYSFPEGTETITKDLLPLYYDQVVSFVIPNGVRAIGRRTSMYVDEVSVFGGCISMKEIHIPEGVTEIGAFAFLGCTALEKIHLPNSVTEIREQAFSGCTALRDVHLPEGLKEIGWYEFVRCTTLKEIHIPDSVMKIREGAFSGCTLLEDIHIPESVTAIETDTFKDCTALEEIHIPDGVTVIGTSSFGGCTALKEVRIPEGVTKIGRGAFAGCISLKEIHIPEGVVIIESYVFAGCISLKEIHIPEGVIKIEGGSDFFGMGGAFKNCTSLEEITIPISVREIGDNAFAGCTSLKRVTISANFKRDIKRIFGEDVDPSIFTFVE